MSLVNVASRAPGGCEPSSPIPTYPGVFSVLFTASSAISTHIPDSPPPSGHAHLASPCCVPGWGAALHRGSCLCRSNAAPVTRLFICSPD